MKNGKIPYSNAELEIVRFEAEDVLTTSNMEDNGQGGVDWGGDDWGNTKGGW